MSVLFGLNGRVDEYRLMNGYKYAARRVERYQDSMISVVQTFRYIHIHSQPPSRPRIIHHHELRYTRVSY
jgi:hypothetical protein